MALHITAEDIVFHELLRRSGEPDRSAIRYAIEGLRCADQLRAIVSAVLAIADDLKTELAEIARGGGYPVGDPQYPHKVVAGGPPCPSCGFRIPLKVYTRLTDQELNDLVRSSPLQRQGADLTEAEIEAFRIAWQGSRAGVVTCQHGQCPHVAVCRAAGECTERAMTLPAYLPLRKVDE